VTSPRLTDDQLAAIRQRASGVDLLAFHSILLAQADRAQLLAEVDALRAELAALREIDVGQVRLLQDYARAAQPTDSVLADLRAMIEDGVRTLPRGPASFEPEGDDEPEGLDADATEQAFRAIAARSALLSKILDALRPFGVPKTAWTDLLPETGERGALPPERRLVLLRVGVRDEARRTLTEQPDVYAVGYVRHGSGGHYFVIPGYPADFIVRAWADVLPSGLSLWSINTGERT
jgi:hypothetical protein